MIDFVFFLSISKKNDMTNNSLQCDEDRYCSTYKVENDIKAFKNIFKKSQSCNTF